MYPVSQLHALLNIFELYGEARGQMHPHPTSSGFLLSQGSVKSADRHIVASRGLYGNPSQPQHIQVHYLQFGAPVMFADQLLAFTNIGC